MAPIQHPDWSFLVDDSINYPNGLDLESPSIQRRQFLPTPIIRSQPPGTENTQTSNIWGRADFSMLQPTPPAIPQLRMPSSQPIRFTNPFQTLTHDAETPNHNNSSSTLVNLRAQLDSPEISPRNTSYLLHNQSELARERVQTPTASISSILSTTITTAASTSTVTIDGNRAAQQDFFRILEEICTEAARRSWHNEHSRQAVRMLASAGAGIRFVSHEADLAGANYGGRQRRSVHGPSRHNDSRNQNYRYAPYRTPAPTHQHQYQQDGYIHWRLTDYISAMADIMWQNARLQVISRHEGEALAIEEMRWLYDVGLGVVNACEAVEEREEVLSLEEVRWVAAGAEGLCAFFGFAEGVGWCREMALEAWGAL